MRLLLLLCFLIVPSAFICNGYATEISRVTGVYSDMEFNSESGDVVGVEVILVFSREGYFAIFQSAEGAPSVPVVVPASVKSEMVQFEVPVGNGVSVFNGSVSKEMLIGEFSGGAINKEGRRVFLLPRRLSYWQ